MNLYECCCTLFFHLLHFFAIIRQQKWCRLPDVNQVNQMTCYFFSWAHLHFWDFFVHYYQKQRFLLWDEIWNGDWTAVKRLKEGAEWPRAALLTIAAVTLAVLSSCCNDVMRSQTQSHHPGTGVWNAAHNEDCRHERRRGGELEGNVKKGRTELFNWWKETLQLNARKINVFVFMLQNKSILIVLWL